MKDCFYAIGIVLLLYSICALSIHRGQLFSLHNTAVSKMLFFGEWTLPFTTKTVLLGEGIIQFLQGVFPWLYVLLPLCFFASALIPYYFLALYPAFFYMFYFFLFPGAVAHYSCRYQHIFIPLFLIAVLSGLSYLFNTAKTYPRKIITGLLFIVIMYNHILAYTVQKQNYWGYTLLAKIPFDVAMWIKQTTPSHAIIALHDIGIISYFSNRKILDLVGLVNPEVRNCYWDTKEKKPVELKERNLLTFLKEKRPQYLIVRSDWDRYFNFNRHKDTGIFKIIHRSSPYPFGGIRYLVYQCFWEKTDTNPAEHHISSYSAVN